MLGIGFNPISIAARSQGVGYSADALAYFARMSVQPDAVRKKLIDTTISALKVAGTWSKRSGIYLIAAHDAQSGRLNLKSDTFNLSVIGSPSWTVDRGYQGDGTGAYLDTGYNLASGGGLYQQTSANVAAWSLTSAISAGSLIGAFVGGTGVNINQRGTSDAYTARVNGASAIGTTNTDGSGYYSANRSGTAVRSGKNGVAIVLGTQAADALVNMTLRILTASGTSFRADRVAFAAFGGSFTEAEEAAEYAAIRTYLQALGAVA